MTGSLIVGLEDTDDSKNALARAAEWAQAAGLRLVLVHVRHLPVFAEMSPMSIGPARQNLDLIEAAARRAAEDALQGTGMDWEFVVRSGAPARELMAVACDRPAMAIVVGGRPHKAALSGPAGSVGAALVHRFRGSVLVVRGDDSAWNPRALQAVPRAAPSQPARLTSRRAPCRRPL
jgi:nucleotide-binding universal stress UspA family protein